MKKHLLFLAVLMMAFASCKKHHDDPADGDPFSVDYANKTIEQNKEALEQNGIDFLSKINTLPNERFIEALENFGELDPHVLYNSVAGAQIFSIDVAAKNKDVNAIFSVLTNPRIKTSSQKLSGFYGIYTWNKNTHNWNKTPSTTSLTFNYPAYQSSTNNNAVLELSYTPASAIATIDDETYELPSTIKASLKVDNKEELSLASAYTYQPDGTPITTDINLVLGSFTFKVNVKNSSQNVTSEISFTKGSETLFHLSADAKGTATVGSIEAAENIEDILKSANTSLDVMDIKLAGQVDVKAISDANNAAVNLSDSDRNKKKAEALNNNAKIVALYKSESKAIAKVEFVPVEDTYSYSYWNGTAYQTYTYIDYYIEPRLVFKDGSKLSMDTFFDSGFSRLINAFEKYTDRF